MTSPIISVVMAVYNTSPVVLTQAIRSIQEQIVQNWELVIVNDGSDSQVTSLLKEFQKKDARIRIIDNQQNKGLTVSLNIGMKECRAAYIARMDADDIALPHRFAQQLSFLQSNNYDLVSANATFIDDKNHELSYQRKNFPSGPVTKKELFHGNYLIHSTFFGTREVFNQGYDETFRYAQDYEFLLRLLSKQFKVGYDPQILLLYRRGEKTLSQSKHREQEYAALRARWKAMQHLNYGVQFLPHFLFAALKASLPLQLKQNLLSLWHA
jgi:glycosyltransferase involved in cell wall biosynthesis